VVGRSLKVTVTVTAAGEAVDDVFVVADFCEDGTLRFRALFTAGSLRGLIF